MLIPFQNIELERVYTQTLAGKVRSLAITSANAGEGVTTLATALAHRNLMAGRSTLLVDLNLWNPSLNGVLDLDTAIEEKGLLPSPRLISSGSQSDALIGITAPTKRDAVLKLREPGVLEQCIEEWHKDYDTVIIDTSPINRVNARNIPAERVAAACDAAILSVLAGMTSETMVSSAVKKLNEAGALLLGSVINDRFNPSLKDELLREIRRISRLRPLARWLSNKVQGMRLLSLEV